MRGLTLVNSKNATLPSEQALAKCFDFPGSARYLLDRLEDRLSIGKLSKSSEAKNILQQIRQWVETIEKLEHTDTPWSGNIPPESSFMKLHQVFATEASDNIREKYGDTLQFDFALGAQSEFLRAYSVNGVVMDEKEENGKQGAKLADELFNAWLAIQFGYVSKDGKIYEADPTTGKIKLDGNGNMIAADVEAIKNRMRDPKDSFEGFLHERGIALKAQEHPFPRQEQAKAAQPAAKRKAPKAQVASKKSAEGPAVEPGDETPSVPGQG